MKYKWSHILEYAAVRAVSAALVLLPHRVTLALAWGPARLAWALQRQRRAQIRRRLRQALGPDKTDAELRRIAWLAFRNLTFTAVESIRLPGISRAWVNRHMELADMDEVRTMLAAGQGLIAAVPHMGNWELAGIALQAQQVNVITLVRRQKNPLMDAWLNRLRGSTGVEAIYTRSRAIADIPHKLRVEKKVLAILPDVRAKAEGVPVRYFGVATTVPNGAAYYARASGVPIFTAEVIRTGWAQHGWRKTGSIESDRSLPEAEDQQRIMQYIMTRFAESVRANPENYFWFNKRWVLGEEQRP